MASRLGFSLVHEQVDIISFGDPQPVPHKPLVLQPIPHNQPDPELARVVLSHIAKTTGGITIPFTWNMQKIRSTLHSHRISSHE